MAAEIRLIQGVRFGTGAMGPPHLSVTVGQSDVVRRIELTEEQVIVDLVEAGGRALETLRKRRLVEEQRHGQ